MEMSTGVSLLRTAQSLLTGRIIALLYEYVLDDDWFWQFTINRNIF